MPGTWALGWVTGDVVTAAEFRKGAGAIFDTTLGAAAASVDITPIVATYAHLRIEIVARGDTAATATAVVIRYNNDSAANYDHQIMGMSNATAIGIEALAGTSAWVGYMPAATAPANASSNIEVVVAGYAGTTFQKAATSACSLKTTVATGGLTTYANAHWWRSTAAINRVTLLANAGNFVAGSRVTIYAMGA